MRVVTLHGLAPAFPGSISPTRIHRLWASCRARKQSHLMNGAGWSGEGGLFPSMWEGRHSIPLVFLSVLGGFKITHGFFVCVVFFFLHKTLSKFFYLCSNQRSNFYYRKKKKQKGVFFVVAVIAKKILIIIMRAKGVNHCRWWLQPWN